VNRAPGAAAFAYPWLYPISEPSKRWPDAIAQAGIHAVAKTPIENTREAVGESAIDSLGKDEADELLIDDLVILPGRLVFDPKGEVAR
jgi:hypothetical protein